MLHQFRSPGTRPRWRPMISSCIPGESACIPVTTTPLPLFSLMKTPKRDGAAGGFSVARRCIRSPSRLLMIVKIICSGDCFTARTKSRSLVIRRPLIEYGDGSVTVGFSEKVRKELA